MTPKPPASAMTDFWESVFKFFDRISAWEFSLGNTRVSVFSLLVVLVLFIGFILASKLVREFLRRRVFPRFHVDRAHEFAILRITHYCVLALGVLVCLSTLGVNLSSIAFVAGLLSVGIGFGLQNIIQNFVAGVIILLEQPIRVGDWVTVGGLEGEVKEIRLRSTAVETNDHYYIIVPNTDLIISQVVNGSEGEPYIRIHVAVGVSYKSDMKLVRKVLLETAVAHPEVMADPPPAVWMTEFADSSVNFDLQAHIQNPRHKEHIRADLRERIWWALKEAHIEIPFPQRDLHLVEPVRVTVQKE